MRKRRTNDAFIKDLKPNVRWDVKNNAKNKFKYDGKYDKNEVTSKTEAEKVLGINWDEKRDIFISVNRSINEAVSLDPTKRNVLKITAGIYNPLGFMEPLFKYEFLHYGIICLHIMSELILPVLLFECCN